jgi:hypothetical protein
VQHARAYLKIQRVDRAAAGAVTTPTPVGVVGQWRS